MSKFKFISTGFPTPGRNTTGVSGVSVASSRYRDNVTSPCLQSLNASGFSLNTAQKANEVFEAEFQCAFSAAMNLNNKAEGRPVLISKTQENPYAKDVQNDWREHLYLGEIGILSLEASGRTDEPREHSFHESPIKPIAGSPRTASERGELIDVPVTPVRSDLERPWLPSTIRTARREETQESNSEADSLPGILERVVELHRLGDYYTLIQLKKTYFSKQFDSLHSRFSNLKLRLRSEWTARSHTGAGESSSGSPIDELRLILNTLFELKENRLSDKADCEVWIKQCQKLMDVASSTKSKSESTFRNWIVVYQTELQDIRSQFQDVRKFEYQLSKHYMPLVLQFLFPYSTKQHIQFAFDWDRLSLAMDRLNRLLATDAKDGFYRGRIPSEYELLVHALFGVELKKPEGGVEITREGNEPIGHETIEGVSLKLIQVKHALVKAIVSEFLSEQLFPILAFNAPGDEVQVQSASKTSRKVLPVSTPRSTPRSIPAPDGLPEQDWFRILEMNQSRIPASNIILKQYYEKKRAEKYPDSLPKDGVPLDLLSPTPTVAVSEAAAAPSSQEIMAELSQIAKEYVEAFFPLEVACDTHENAPFGQDDACSVAMTEVSVRTSRTTSPHLPLLEALKGNVANLQKSRMKTSKKASSLLGWICSVFNREEGVDNAALKHAFVENGWHATRTSVKSETGVAALSRTARPKPPVEGSNVEVTFDKRVRQEAQIKVKVGDIDLNEGAPFSIYTQYVLERLAQEKNNLGAAYLLKSTLKEDQLLFLTRYSIRLTIPQWVNLLKQYPGVADVFRTKLSGEAFGRLLATWVQRKIGGGRLSCYSDKSGSTDVFNSFTCLRIAVEETLLIEGIFPNKRIRLGANVIGIQSTSLTSTEKEGIDAQSGDVAIYYRGEDRVELQTIIGRFLSEFYQKLDKKNVNWIINPTGATTRRVSVLGAARAGAKENSFSTGSDATRRRSVMSGETSSKPSLTPTQDQSIDDYIQDTQNLFDNLNILLECWRQTGRLPMTDAAGMIVNHQEQLERCRQTVIGQLSRHKDQVDNPAPVVVSVKPVPPQAERVSNGSMLLATGGSVSHEGKTRQAELSMVSCLTESIPPALGPDGSDEALDSGVDDKAGTGKGPVSRNALIQMLRQYQSNPQEMMSYREARRVRALIEEVTRTRDAKRNRAIVGALAFGGDSLVPEDSDVSQPSEVANRDDSDSDNDEYSDSDWF